MILNKLVRSLVIRPPKIRHRIYRFLLNVFVRKSGHRLHQTTVRLPAVLSLPRSAAQQRNHCWRSTKTSPLLRFFFTNRKTNSPARCECLHLLKETDKHCDRLKSIQANELVFGELVFEMSGKEPFLKLCNVHIRIVVYWPQLAQEHTHL